MYLTKHGDRVIATPEKGSRNKTMVGFQVQPLEKFSFKPEEWPKWIWHFERFGLALGLSKENGSQAITLAYSIGDEAADMLQSFKLTDANRKKYDPVKMQSEGHFIIKGNVIFERNKFNMRVQREGEPVDSFITDLYSVAKHCNLGILHDELICDGIVVGITDMALSEKLQLEAELTLERAIN